jgi:sugar lactone lactonase YvrE
LDEEGETLRQLWTAGTALAAILLAGRADADSSRTRARGVDRFLVSVLREGVSLYNLRGDVLWSHRCDPYDAAETGTGEVVIACRTEGRVFKVTRDGKTTWEKNGLQGPVNAEPLPNGNILIVENDTGRVLEVAPDGGFRREIGGHRTPFDARRRANGNIVVADSGNNRIVEYDPQGVLIRQTPGLKFPNSLYLYPSGRTLFTTYVNGSVGELDAEGNLVWERQIGGTLYSVEPEGESIWVAEGAGGRILRIARDGTILREIKLGKTFIDVAYGR